VDADFACLGLESFLSFGSRIVDEKRVRERDFCACARNRRRNLYLRYNERRKFKISCCCDGLSALKLFITPLASELHFERWKRF